MMPEEIKMEPSITHTSQPITGAWSVELENALCEHCDWSYLLPKGSLPQRCPHCFQANLSPWGGSLEDLPHIHPPELVLPYILSAGRLAQAVEKFAGGIPFAPEDLSIHNLQARLRRLYLPMWLVDAEVQATWQAEAGFNYNVVSHQDHFEENRGGWTSRQIEEGRIRWEPRLGKLDRTYQNIAAPALEENQRLKSALDSYDLSAASAYQPNLLESAYVRLPNRATQDAWSDAKPALQSAAADECRQAAGADHIRQFSWNPEYHNQNWTLLLLPLYTTYYQDDQGQPQAVLVNGQSGQISGRRRASMKRAQRTALGILIASIILFLISLGIAALAVALPILLALGVIGLVLALLLGLGAIYPLASVWWFNGNHK
jgi:hypothetical protein